MTAKLPKDLPDVLVDENQITQVILNLLTNAQQAMEATQKRGTIKVRATSSDGRVRLSIADNGPGIAAEHLPQVFDPFFTTKEVGKGTGLGLSVSYGIVQQL